MQKSPEKPVHEYKLGEILYQGKFRDVTEVRSAPHLCHLSYREPAKKGDAPKTNTTTLLNKTNTKMFELLNTIGIKTAFIKSVGDTSFVAKRCYMIPIYLVVRRIASGSYLQRHPHAIEGFRFAPPLIEAFYKEDESDEVMSRDEIVGVQIKVNKVPITHTEVDTMFKTALLVFEILERVWMVKDSALVELKIEFGLDLQKKEILVADTLDSDSFTLWSFNEKKLKINTQFHRQLAQLSLESDSNKGNRTIQWISKQLDSLEQINQHLIVILMGNAQDESHCKSILKHCQQWGLHAEMRVVSLIKNYEEALKVIKYYESLPLRVIFIAVMARANALGPVLSGNSPFPVINCPIVKNENIDRDIWSSLNVPGGLGCSTLLSPESAALNAAHIVGLTNSIVWGKLKLRELENYVATFKADKQIVHSQ